MVEFPETSYKLKLFEEALTIKVFFRTRGTAESEISTKFEVVFFPS